jgi:hypothetical protein
VFQVKKKRPFTEVALVFSITRWCIPPGNKRRSQRKRTNVKNYLHSNRNFIAFLAFFFGVNAAVFAQRIYFFRDAKNLDETANVFLMLARANGQCSDREPKGIVYSITDKVRELANQFEIRSVRRLLHCIKH